MRKTMMALLSVSVLVACAKQPSQNQYVFDEVGVSRIVEFATVVSMREIGITGENTGVGALAGAGVGAGAASYAGDGSGQAWAVAGGAVAGAIAGAAAEQAMADRKGIEYVVTTEKGVTKTVVQNIAEGEAIFQVGTRVMVQTSGSYQRVLSAQALPTEIKRPKGIKVTD